MKKIITFFAIFILIFCPSFSSNASGGGGGTSFGESSIGPFESIDWTLVEDDTGHLTGRFYFIASYIEPNGEFSKVDSYDLGVELDGKPYGGYLYLVKDESSTDSESVYGLYGNGELYYTLTSTRKNLMTEETWVHERNSSGYKLGIASEGTFFGNFTTISTSGLPPVIDTNIPIFSGNNLDAIKAYEETGDASGADNYDKYKGDKYDSSIPTPHDFKVIQGVDQTIAGVEESFLADYNKDIVLTWRQDDVIDNLEYEIEGDFYYKRISDSNFAEIQEMNTGYKEVVPRTSYGSSTSSTVQIPKSTLNGLKERGYQTKVYFRVRNVIANKTSNWVLVKIDLVNKTATATEQSYYDNSDTGGDEYNDDNVDYDSDNSNSNANNGSISLDGLMTYIKSGFGLLGSGGLIALMSSTFSYIPASVWTLIKMAISISIAIMILALVKRFVFG